MSTPTGPSVLVTLDEAIQHLNLDADIDLDRDQLQGFIDAATAYIQNATGPIIPRTYTEVHSGGRSTVFVFHPPILSVTSVVEYVAATGYALTQVALGDATGAYAFSVDDPRSGAIRRRYNGGLVGPFAAGDHNVAVTYVGGLAALPPDIRMAVLQDIAGLYQPSQLGTNPYGNDAALGNAPLNPVGMFPRVAEILSAVTMRTPAIG